MSGHLTLARDAIEKAIEHLDQMAPRKPDVPKLWADHFREDLKSLALLAERE